MSEQPGGKESPPTPLGKRTNYRKALGAVLGQLRGVVQLPDRLQTEADEFHIMTDQAIREDLRKLRAILSAAADAIVTINDKGVIAAANPATLKMFGYVDQELVGQNVSVLMPEPYRGEHDQYLANYLQTGQAKIIGSGRELTAQRKDGSVFPIELTVTEFQDGVGPMFVGIIHDISERKRMEQHLSEASVHERHRIARELHDSLGGQMTGIALLAKALQTKLHRAESEHAKDLDELVGYIGEAHAQLRAISSGLAPVELIPEGLCKALGDLAELTDRTQQLHCEFTGDGTEVSDPTVALHLYRIAQEAVSNAIRHGLPSEIEIVLEQEGPYTTLTISNDGHSIQHAPDTHDGMGIRTMKHRADLIQGSLRVAPAEGGGTVVSCRVPNKEHRHGHEQDKRT